MQNLLQASLTCLCFNIVVLDIGNCSGDSGPEISEDLSVLDLLVLHSVFNVYAVGKSWLNIVQGKQNGPTSYGGYELYK
jgi:hypothetical protein